MFYKKTAFHLLPLASFLLISEAGCWTRKNKNPVVSSTTEQGNNNNNNNGNNGIINNSQLQVEIPLFKTLGTLSTGSTETKLLLHSRFQVSNIDSNAAYYAAFQVSNIDSNAAYHAAFIGVMDGDASITKESPIVKTAIDGIHNNNDFSSKFEWQQNDSFILSTLQITPTAGNNEYDRTIAVNLNQQEYEKLCLNDYQIHLLCLQNNLSAISDSVDMEKVFTYHPLPDYDNVQLKAKKISKNASGFILTGDIESSYKNNADAKVGFILVRKRQGVDPYDLVQKLIADKDGWPTGTEAEFYGDDLVIVPGVIRNIANDPIYADLPSTHAPKESEEYNAICYLVQNEHYYLSQIEHFSSNAPPQSDAPPSMVFDNNSYDVKVDNLNIVVEQGTSGQVQNVKITNSPPQYFINNQPEALPSNTKLYLAIVKNNAIWRTADLLSSCQTLGTTSAGSIITDNKTTCLLSPDMINKSSDKYLDSSCRDFFNDSTESGYQYFAFLVEDDKLNLRGSKASLNLSVEKQAQQQVQNVPNVQVDPVRIELEKGNANIDIKRLGTPAFLRYKAIFTRPEVKLHPTEFDKSQFKHSGFIIGKTGTLNIETYIANITNIINEQDKTKQVFQDNQLVIFKEDAENSDLSEKLYSAYHEHKNENVDTIYWAEHNNGKIICSNAVSVGII